MYSYPFSAVDPGYGLGVAAFFMAAVYLIIFAYSILTYVLQSLGMYTIAKRRGIHHPWLAWLPIANMWLLGSISDQYQYVAKGRVRNRRKVLLGMEIALCVLVIPIWVLSFMMGFYVGIGQKSDSDMIGLLLSMLGVFLVMMVLAVVVSIFVYITLYDLYASCDPNNAVLFLVLGIFFSFLLPFFIFACRNKDKGMPPRRPQVFQQPPWSSQSAAPAVAPAAQQPDESVTETEVTREDFADEE